MINPLSDNTFKAPAPLIPFTSSNGNCCCELTEIIPIDVSNPIGTNVVRGIIKFTNQTPIELLNYNTTLKQIYGNNLIALDIFLTGYTKDEQTPPTITYATLDDPTTDIISIVWNYPFPVSGYILIAGVLPVTGTPTSNPVPLVFNYTDANLLQDTDDIWYLPLTLPLTLRPYYVEVNGNQLQTTYERTSSRLYGFANNNSPQTILVSIQ